MNELKENLEERLTGIQNEIEDFKEKEISRDMEEVYADKKLLDDINKRILECQKEAQNVNNEEELLGLFLIIFDYIICPFAIAHPFNRKYAICTPLIAIRTLHNIAI